MIAGNPQRAGRRRSGAADLIRFLAEQDAQPLQARHQRRCHAGRAGACDQEIDLASLWHCA
jgi:hypothetical protein